MKFFELRPIINMNKFTIRGKDDIVIDYNKHKEVVDKSDVVSFTCDESEYNIVIDYVAMKFEPKKQYYFRVYQSAEGCVSGYVKLTYEQALAVAFACNSDNWKRIDCDEPWSGSFSIILDDVLSVEDVEGS